MVEWREDLRRCLLQAGVKDTPTSFVFTDAQVVMESFLEDVNNILNAGADSASHVNQFLKLNLRRWRRRDAIPP